MRQEMARSGWNLPYSKVNLQYVSSDVVSVMKQFLKNVSRVSRENELMS